MRLLRVLGLGLVAPWRRRDITAAVVGPDHLAGGDDGLLRHLHAIGAHVGDQADGLAADVGTLIKPLRQPHGLGWREAELAARLLLQRGGGERWRRMAFGRLGLDRGDRESCRFQRPLESFGLRSGADIEPLDLLAVGPDQPRFEGLAPRGRQNGGKRPIFARDELFDLELAVADQSQRDRLNPPGRAGARQLAPQNRGQRETDKIVERAARQVGVHQGRVDGARVLHRLGDRRLGDRVEHHPFDRLLLKCPLFLQNLQDVPGDRLALAVRVGRQDQLVGAFDGAGDLRQALLRLGIDLPDHAEVRLGVDRTGLGRQITDMAEGGQHLIATAEILVDCLGLSR